MPKKATPGSFTKNFAWGKDPKRLHKCIYEGFSGILVPVTRSEWRENCGINNRSLELVPLNFFLYSNKVGNTDYVIPDPLVEVAVTEEFGPDFLRLWLATFHLNMSGSWRNSKWPNGSVASWANAYVRERAWKDGAWTADAFAEKDLDSFLLDRVDALPDTRHKMITNYRFMLSAAGVLSKGKVVEFPVNAPWRYHALDALWTRASIDAGIHSWDSASLQELAFEHEAHRLFACSEQILKSYIASSIKRGVIGKLSARINAVDQLHLSVAA